MLVKLYIDVLFVTNLAISIVLISAAAEFTHSVVSPKRLFAASLIGALSSLSIMTGSKAVSVSVKLAAIVIMCAIAFNTLKPRVLVKRSVILSLVQLTFLAAVYLLWYFTGSGKIYILYGTVYFDVSVLTLVFAGIACYTIISAAEKLYSEYTYRNGAYKVQLTIKDRSYSFEALADTGNMVRDHITGKPVVVLISDKICSDFDLFETLPEGFRIMPYTTVSSSSLMWIAKPQDIKISDGKGNVKPVSAAVGIVEGSSEQAIFNPGLLT